jgi:putative membrane protein
MVKWFVNWFLSALALLVVAKVVPGVHVSGFSSALWAALVFGLVNATLGTLLKVVTLPLTVITLGLFVLVINAVMFKFAAWFAPGFSVFGFWAAFWGAFIMSLVSLVLRRLVWGHRA